MDWILQRYWQGFPFVVVAANRGGKIGPVRWASPAHPELGLGWAIKLFARKKPGQIWPGPIWPSPVWPDPSEYFLPSKGYLTRPARFLGRARLLKFWPEKIGPILSRPGFGPTHYWPSPARSIASSNCKWYGLDNDNNLNWY